MDYNSNRKKLVLPEYGRHIQQMVDHALTIEDREERMHCARSVINIMGTMFPHLRDVSDFKHKLWDHLAIMADFKLDIDYPYEVPQPSSFNQPPLRVPYQNKRIRYMQYGRIVEELIEKAISHEDEAEKKQLIQLIVGHMKKSLMAFNRDNATDERVFDDLKTLSGGRLQAEPQMRMPEFRESAQVSGSGNFNQNYRNKKKKQVRKK
jgi:hypothetical protein